MMCPICLCDRCHGYPRLWKLWAASTGTRRTAYERIHDELNVEPLPSVGKTWKALRLVKACRYRSTRSCGCSGARCALRFAQTEYLHIVNIHDCLACVAKYGDT